MDWEVHSEHPLRSVEDKEFVACQLMYLRDLGELDLADFAFGLRLRTDTLDHFK